jgi:hypothetical protein
MMEASSDNARKLLEHPNSVYLLYVKRNPIHVVFYWTAEEKLQFCEHNISIVVAMSKITIQRQIE